MFQVAFLKKISRDRDEEQENGANMVTLRGRNPWWHYYLSDVTPQEIVN